MTSLTQTFASLGAGRKPALIPYFMAFYPDAPTFAELLLASREAGADIIEIGLPFSDPIADGPAIQRAGQVALSNGATPGGLFSLLERLRGRLSVPLVVMSYANVPVRFGSDRFFSRAGRAGVRGIVVPDMILEESAAFRREAGAHGLDLIQFVSPTTPRARLKDISRAARGFVYLVSVTGVTGARSRLPSSLRRYAAAVRKSVSVPVCVGFGVSTPRQAAELSRAADGVIIGSALVELIERQASPVRAVSEFLREARREMDSSGEHR